MSRKPETPTAAAMEVSSVLSGGHPQGASGNGQSSTPSGSEQEGKTSRSSTSAMTSQTDISFTATIPQVGAYRTQDHRYYWNGKGPLPSVTSILSVLDKPAVVQWAKRVTAEGAVNRQEELRSLLLNPDKEYVANVLYGFQKDGVDIPPSREQILSVGPVGSDARKDSLVRWLARLPDYIKDTAGQLGSGIHLLADMASRGDGSFQPSELEKPYLAAFQNFLSWLREVRAEIISSEKMVWSSDGYAGTYDLIIKMPIEGLAESRNPSLDRALNLLEHPTHELWLLDIKTSKGYYPETALQLIAYGYADQIILEGNPDGYPMPSISRYGVLHLRPDLYLDTGWRLIEYPVQDSDYVAFLGALELYRWKQEGRYQKKNLKTPTGPIRNPSAQDNGR